MIRPPPILRTTRHDALLHQVANAYHLPFNVLQAQMIAESNGDPWAFRYEPAYFLRYIFEHPEAKAYKYGPLAACSFGLLQILLETAMEIGFDGQPHELFNVRVGLSWGAKYLRQCWDHVGGQDSTLKQALARYNGIGSKADRYADLIYRAAGMDA